MDFLKTLLAYMAATLVVAVESTSTPAVTQVPTPAPTDTAAPAAVDTVTQVPALAETFTPVPTVSVTPEPVPTITPNAKGYHNLVQGDRGDEVRRLQEKLIELGYLPEGAADGAYGGQTRMAVRRFQYYNSLTVDGVAGRATQTNLFENPDVRPYPEQETPTPDVTGTPEPEAPTEAPEPTVTPVVVGNAAAEESAAPEEAETQAPEETEQGQTSEETEKEAPEETEPTAAETTAPSEEPSAPSEEASAPVNETAAPAEEVTAPTEEATPEAAEASTELVEDVDLDELEGTPSPEPDATEAPTPIPYEDLAGWIVLNEAGDSMQWTELEDGVPVVRSPRLQRYGDDIRVSLDDLCKSVESWQLTDEGDSLVLEAQGFTLALLNEDAGFVSMVDGLEMVTEFGDFEFSEGHFIRVDFLTRALDGAWEWDAQEEMLLLIIPEKNPSLYSD